MEHTELFSTNSQVVAPHLLHCWSYLPADLRSDASSVAQDLVIEAVRRWAPGTAEKVTAAVGDFNGFLQAHLHRGIDHHNLVLKFSRLESV